MGSGHAVAVYGAYGHTGRFVVAELRERGFTPVLSGRDPEKLRALGPATRPAAVTDPVALDRALDGVAAVVNCAGPFATTAAPVAEAALRAGVPYLDVAAEIEAIGDTLTAFADRAEQVVLPAMAFFGGLGDLLVTAAAGDRSAVDEAHVAYWLSGWHPTPGTRAAGRVSRERRGGRRVRHANGGLHLHDDVPGTEWWRFPAPLGRRAVVPEFSMADVVTVPSHLAVREVRTYLSVEAAGEVAAGDTPAPVPVDERGRSAQTFLVDVVVRAGGATRRAVARGQDIYAVTAPLVVEAVERVLAGRVLGTGAGSAGALFDAPDFLAALAPHLTVDLSPEGPAPGR